MANYLLAVGGSGAKCAEAITYLAAAGLIPGNLYIMYIDPDEHNGNLEVAKQICRKYIGLRNYLKLANTGELMEFLRPEITLAKPEIWTPFDKETPADLNLLFDYSGAGENARMMDVLYTRDERKQPLTEGFRGHPAIGSAVLSKTACGDKSPWDDLWGKVFADKEHGGSKIFLVGSIFGGTGAAGIPTLARLIFDRISTECADSVMLGAALILPYFKFVNPISMADDSQGSDKDKIDNLYANSDHFLLRTQEALKYYYECEEMRIYKALYLIGEKYFSDLGKFAKGRKEQCNLPHYIEMYGALAAIDFFLNDTEGYFRVDGANENTLTWQDLPLKQRKPAGKDDIDLRPRLRHRMEQLTQFSFAYLSTYHLMIEDIFDNGGKYRAPWFSRYFGKLGKDERDAARVLCNDVADFCRLYLTWAANIQESGNFDDNPELRTGFYVQFYRYEAFATKKKNGRKNECELKPENSFELSHFKNLLLPESKENKTNLDKLWWKMCTENDKGNSSPGIGRFIYALYKNCKEF